MTEQKSKTVEALNSFARGVSIAGTHYPDKVFAEIKKIQREHDVTLSDAADMWSWWHAKDTPH